MSYPFTGRGASAPAWTPSDLVDGDTAAFHYSPVDSVIYSSGTTVANVNDAINGTVSDLTGNGNDATGGGVTLRLDADGQLCFRVDDDTTSMDLAIPTTLPALFTLVYTMNNDRNDTLGYTIGSSGENEGFALVQGADTAAPIGIGGTVNRTSFNNKTYASATKRMFLDVPLTTGTVTVAQEIENATGSAATAYGIGHGSFKLHADFYEMFYIERALTNAEMAQLVNYMAGKHGETHKGTPYDTDIMHFKGQSNMVGTANDATIASPAMTDGNLSINYATNTNSLVFPLADPINNNTLGQSMVPAFANEWFAQTGNVICSVMSASGGSSLLPYASSNWGTVGAVLAASKVNIDEAVDELANHANYEVASIYDVWLQGETEVLNDNGTTITAANYQIALDDLADDAKTWYDANHAGLFQGTHAIVLSPRYEDSSEFAMQFVDMVLHNNEYNLAIVDAAAGTANLDIAYKGSGAYQGMGEADGWAYDNVHFGTRAVQEAGKVAAMTINNASATPVTPTSPYLGSTLFMDDSQSTKNTRTESATTEAGTTCLMVAVSGHQFATGSGQIHHTVTFDGVDMARGGSIESENVGEVGAGHFYLNDDLYGGSLAGVTGDVIVNTVNVAGSAKTVNVINFAVISAKDCYRAERVQGNIDLASTTTASHTIEPLLGSMLINVTAANLDSATPTTAATANLTEIIDSAYTITGQSKTAQFTVSHGIVDAGNSVTPSVVFGATMDEIAPITVAMRGKQKGEGSAGDGTVFSTEFSEEFA